MKKYLILAIFVLTFSIAAVACADNEIIETEHEIVSDTVVDTVAETLDETAVEESAEDTEADTETDM